MCTDKNIKGFTLVELLSVIALLAMLSIIVIPNIDKLLKDSKEDIYSNQISSIIMSAKLWATEEENMILLEQNEVWPFVLTLSDLQTNGFIDTDIINPKTDEKIKETLLIYINKINDKYTYSVDESSDDPLAPIITMNGDKVITLEIQNDYSDEGAVAIKPDGTSNPITTVIKKNGITSDINANQTGIYTITYSSEYIANDIPHKAMAVRVLKYVDTIAPVITCDSCVNGTIIESTDTYTFPSVTVTDNSGESLNALITGSFSSKIPGNKTIVYQATDSSGNTGTLEVSYIVKDTIAPEFTYKLMDNNKFEIIAAESGSGVKEYSFDNGTNWQKSSIIEYDCGGSDILSFILAVKDYSGNINRKKIEILCKKEWDYSYTGNEQIFNVPYSGWYKIELWGAQGGGDSTKAGGLGAYTNGKIFLTRTEQIYIYIGGQGLALNTVDYNQGGYNGGGTGGNYAGAHSFGGGGATDIRLLAGNWDNSTGLNSRIMIAAGGSGSASSEPYLIAGYGGDLVGGLGSSNREPFSSSSYYNNGATQTMYGINSSNSAKNGKYGMALQSTVTGWGGGGGGGYYGGSMGHGTGGSGGSSFISGYAGVNAITSSSSLTPTNNTMHYSGKYFIDGKMEAGINEGNGKAKITYLSETKPNRANTKLNNVRYIKDCINGNNIDIYNVWVELQAIKDGINISKGKIATGIINNSSYPLTRITDGDITAANHAADINPGGGYQCMVLDLGSIYDLDEIAIWHYWQDNRTYYSNTTSVSNDNNNWVVVNSTEEPETSNGKRVSAYENNTNTDSIIYRITNLVINGSFENVNSGWIFNNTLGFLGPTSSGTLFGNNLLFNYQTNRPCQV